MTPLPPPAPLLTVPEIPVLAAPEAVAKTARSVTLRLRVDHLANPDKRFSFQLSHSEHGYVYYSWTESDLFPGKSCPIKGLMPATNYVFRVRVVDAAAKRCGEWSPLTPYIRTFTEEEDAKRAGTIFEHTLKLERQQKNQLQSQISRLTVMLDARSKDDSERQNKAKMQEDMLASRRIMDTTIQKLQRELHAQSSSLQTLKSQRAADEEVITQLLNEQEALRTAQAQQQDSAQYELEMQQLRAQLEKNEQALRKHQEQVNASHEQIASYEASLEATREEIEHKEDEVEKLMADCNRMMQEQADAAAVKQLEIEDALVEAKTALEQQLLNNTYLNSELVRLREENHHLKNQINEMDSEVVPKLVRLEEENEQLRAALAARGGR